jgi:hypothetical protein
VSGDVREEYPYHRRFIRQRVRVRVEVDAQESHSSWTINVSPDGLCFDLPRRVDPGRDVGVSIFLSRDRRAQPVRGIARVVWNDPAGSGHRHGARFIGFDDGDGDRLARWLGRPASA